jgi:outer membrane protein assembly factor BamB
MLRRPLRCLLPLVTFVWIGGVSCQPAVDKPRSGGPVTVASTAGAPAERPPAGPPRLAGPSEYRPHEFDWPQWQGPERTAVSKETGLLQSWPKDGPKLVWQADYLGEGYSTPTVAGGRIFSMGNHGNTEYVQALSEADGGQIWATPVGPVRSNGGNYPGPRCSPTVDGDRVYALGLNGDLLCLEAATGKERWRKNLPKDFGGAAGGWGYSESPLVDGGKLLCTPGGKQATLVALDKETGSTIWKGEVPGGDVAHYASMIAVDVGGKREYVQFLSGGVVGLGGDGHFLWRYAKPANGTANCSTALFRDGSVFAASDYGNGGGLAKLEPQGKDEVKAEEVYFTKHMRNHHGGMVLVGDHIYGADDSRFACLEWKTGNVKWSESKPGKGSVACADGRLYYRNEGGPVVLAEVNPGKYVECARFSPPQSSGKPQWPHPVIANGKLYIRDQEYLFCYDVKKAAAVKQEQEAGKAGG